MRWTALLITFLLAGGTSLARAETATADVEMAKYAVNTEHLLTQAEIASGTSGASKQGDSLMAISPELRAFIDGVDPDASPVKRFRKILSALKDEGFQLEFDLNHTTNASEAFAERRGNCISFTALMVAIARDVGLEASFNRVESPVKRSPLKNAQGRQVVQNVLHVNAKVKFGWIMRTIEFNFEPQTKFPDQLLSDSEAEALYLNNLALESLRQDRNAQGFGHIRDAIARHPESSQIWNTLGYLYRQSNMLGLAKKSFHQALNLDELNISAIRNLRHVNRLQESTALSDNRDLTYQHDLIAMSGL